MSSTEHARSVALIGAMTGERRAFHTGGHQAITDEKMLPIADVLLIIADDDPGAMLFRYTAYGELAGDTWHASVEDARAHAAFEYGESLLLPWMDVPEDIPDAHRFASAYARERLNDRGRW